LYKTCNIQHKFALYLFLYIDKKKIEQRIYAENLDNLSINNALRKLMKIPIHFYWFGVTKEVGRMPDLFKKDVLEIKYRWVTGKLKHLKWGQLDGRGSLEYYCPHIMTKLNGESLTTSYLNSIAILIYPDSKTWHKLPRNKFK